VPDVRDRSSYTHYRGVQEGIAYSVRIRLGQSPRSSQEWLIKPYFRNLYAIMHAPGIGGRYTPHRPHAKSRVSDYLCETLRHTWEESQLEVLQFGGRRIAKRRAKRKNPIRYCSHTPSGSQVCMAFLGVSLSPQAVNYPLGTNLDGVPPLIMWH
jgi:hypothetical protein